MADRMSTRTGSRRTTPQPVAENGRAVPSQDPVKRMTHVTRSQSREISDGEGQGRGPKFTKAAKNATPEIDAGRAGQSAGKTRRGRPTKYARVVQDLPAVVESPNVSNRTVKEGEAGSSEDREVDQPTAQATKSPGGASAFSGTTARTSLSNQALSESSPEEMLDALPDLADAASKLLNFLVPEEVTRESVADIVAQVVAKGSRANKNLARLASMLRAQRDIYGGDSYINCQATMKAFFGTREFSNNSTGLWRPDALLQKANLATLASITYAQFSHGPDDHMLEELEQVFPIRFLQGFATSGITVGNSLLLGETFLVAIEVRTQYAIGALARNALQRNFDFDDILHQVFYKSRKSLEGWASMGIRSEDLTNEAQKAILLRLEDLRQAFTDSAVDPAEGIDRLKATYPWSSCSYLLIEWLSQRLNEIEVQIDSRGGANGIHQALSKELQSQISAEAVEGNRDGDDPQLELTYEPPLETSRVASDQQDTVTKRTRKGILNMQEFNPRSPKDIAVTKKLKILLTRHAPTSPSQPTMADVQVSSTAGRSTIPVPSQKGNQSPPQDEQVPFPEPTGGDDDPLFVAEVDGEDALNAKILQLRARNDAESNKENVAQVEAGVEAPLAKAKQRLIDPQEHAEKVQWDSQNSGTGEMSEPSEDEGFQEMRAPAQPARKRSSKSVLKRPAPEYEASQVPSPPKRVRVQENSRVPSLTVSREREELRPSPTQLDTSKEANALAREMTALRPKKVQSRTPWSDEETETLLQLITTYGTSWAVLQAEDKRNGDVLSSRGQVALKDKARNLKMDYLKSSHMLPKNFQNIPLSKLQVDRLKAVNIAYDPETGLREDGEIMDDD